MFLLALLVSQIAFTLVRVSGRLAAGVAVGDLPVLLVGAGGIVLLPLPIVALVVPSV